MKDIVNDLGLDIDENAVDNIVGSMNNNKDDDKDKKDEEKKD